MVHHSHFTHVQTEAHPGYRALRGRVRIIRMSVCPSRNYLPPVTCLGLLGRFGGGTGWVRGGKNEGDCEWGEGVPVAEMGVLGG